MTSFQIGLPANRRRAARFISHVRRTLQNVFAEELKNNKITQSEVARRLDIHRSIISRELSGRRDISVGRIAEYAWALGREIVFDLPMPALVHGDNKPADANIGFVQTRRWQTMTSPLTNVNLHIEVIPPSPHVLAN